VRTRFLWIEDGAIADYKYLLAPIYVAGMYNPVVALDVSEGIRRLKQREFDAVIVDIRLSPGDNPDWIRLYKQLGSNKATARLGSKLLRSILKPDGDDIPIEEIPLWVQPQLFGILTVESAEDLRELEIEVYERKKGRTPENVLKELVDRIVSKNRE
jgi:hypothetical protein